MKRTIRFLTFALALGAGAATAESVELLNVSYDPTRELYVDYNAAFAAHWKQQTGDTVTINIEGIGELTNPCKVIAE